jgi:hypothetical protein
MSHLGILLSHLGLQKYHESLASHGFETWDVLVDISEEDMAELGFKLGHRRKLQRAIADFRGQPHNEALFCSSSDGGLFKSRSSMSVHAGRDEWRVEEPTPSKGRYRRRRLKDPHAPRRPNSGYVLFANFLRQNSQVSNLPFVDISKLVGEKWQCLLPEEKTMWISNAAEEKSKYYRELAEYQQTEDYKRHQDRLRRSKRHNGRLGEGTSTATITRDGSIQMSARTDKEYALS